MTTKNLYKGFSTQEYNISKTFILRDVELVKRDILNHIFTRKGERLRMPDFGTIIPDVIFEPLDDITMSAIRRDLINVIRYDPRVEERSIQLIPFYNESSLLIIIDLDYIEIGMNGILEINLDFEQ